MSITRNKRKSRLTFIVHTKSILQHLKKDANIPSHCSNVKNCEKMNPITSPVLGISAREVINTPPCIPTPLCDDFENILCHCHTRDTLEST